MCSIEPKSGFFSLSAAEIQTLALCVFTIFPYFFAKRPRALRRGAFCGSNRSSGGTSGGARPPGREERDGGRAARCVGPPSPVGRPPETQKRRRVPKTQRRLRACERTALRPFRRPCYPPLQKSGGMGIISPWCSSNCCAEWAVTRTGPLGASTPGGLPHSCFRFHSTSDSPKMQGVFGKSPKKAPQIGRASCRERV